MTSVVRRTHFTVVVNNDRSPVRWFATRSRSCSSTCRRACNSAYGLPTTSPRFGSGYSATLWNAASNRTTPSWLISSMTKCVVE